MTNTTVRLVIVAVLVGLLATLAYAFPRWLSPEIRPPDRDITEIPRQFGSWQDVEVDEMDPKIKEILLRDADVIEDRHYADEKNNIVSLHMAVFTKLDDGIRHSPFNCYRGQGWRELNRADVMLPVSDKSIRVSLTTWERDGQRVMVMYWYQFGEHILFDRLDLGKARLKMRGKKTWPAMVKVLLQTSASDQVLAKRRIEDIAGMAYEWLNQPVDEPNSGSPAG
jgi:EpsI family protein